MSISTNFHVSKMFFVGKHKMFSTVFVEKHKMFLAVFVEKHEMFVRKDAGK